VRLFKKSRLSLVSNAGLKDEGNNVSSNKVQCFRETLMMSKAELARKAGLSTLTIDRVESGRPCRLDTKRKILIALGLKVGEHSTLFSSSEARDSDIDRRQDSWE
jgi:DNA-binding XRE family transcriptional regulator